jgi:hypothetical protein
MTARCCACGAPQSMHCQSLTVQKDPVVPVTHSVHTCTEGPWPACQRKRYYGITCTTPHGCAVASQQLQGTAHPPSWGVAWRCSCACPWLLLPVLQAQHYGALCAAEGSLLATQWCVLLEVSGTDCLPCPEEFPNAVRMLRLVGCVGMHTFET